nr:hypothetical protein [Tanacetum cinerariifolium]
MVRAKELFAWNPSFLVNKENVSSSNDESVHGERPNDNLLFASEEEEGEFINSNIEGVAKTIFGDNYISPERLNSVSSKSKDPFHIYDILNEKKSDEIPHGSCPSLSHPPCFTPDNLVSEKGSFQNIGDGHGSMVNDCSYQNIAQVVNVSQQVQMEGSNDSRRNIAGSKGGSVLGVFEEVIKVGQAMGFSMEGCEKDIKSIIGNQGDDLEKYFFKKDFVTVSDNFIAVYRTWILSNTKFLFISIYAPPLKESYGIIYWFFLDDGMAKLFSWVILTRFFNQFISSSGLIDIKLEGASFTWSHPSATKMSKLDQFLISEGVVSLFPSISGSCLDRHLSDHRPILLHEAILDELSAIDKELDCGQVAEPRLARRQDLTRQLHDIRSIEAVDDLIGPDLYEAVEYFFSNGVFPNGCNSSFIALIPKVTDAKHVSNYRPISMIGGIYKVVTKILASHLAMVISDIVSNTQSAFIAGRQILDGPFIINENLDWCKRRCKKVMFFKVDFAKAYDSVRWEYLIDVLKPFGFGSKWCQWIQGDPLAPLLFILVMESLHLSFNRVVDAGVGVHTSDVSLVAASIGCSIKKNQFRYLGVMVGENMARHKAWSNVTLKLKSRLSKWKTKTLSVSGRLTLLKYVLGASSLFYMSIFKTPKSILKEMESIRNNFFIRAGPSKKKITWVAWNQVLASKEKGGLGVSSFYALIVPLPLNRYGGNGNSTNFWLDIWKGDSTFCELFPRVYALESVKDILVASKMAIQMDSFFRRPARGDRWVCNVAGNGNFSVKIIRNLIDDLILPSSVVSTRWVKSVPIKINIFMWRARRDYLPTRLNLSHRGVVMETVNCPTCGNCEEDVQHIFFDVIWPVMFSEVYADGGSWIGIFGRLFQAGIHSSLLLVLGQI